MTNLSVQVNRVNNMEKNQAQPPHDYEVTQNKSIRRDLDDQIQRVRQLPPSRERSIAITKLQEAVMWMGMDLKRLGEANPYPNSYNPENTKIDPTADRLKL